MSELLDAVITGERDNPTASVIWLHGLGADGHDFEPIVPELGLPKDAGIRFIFPHAPERAVTINGSFQMRAWYDIVGIGPEYPEDDVGIRQSEKQTIAWIEHEIASGIPAERIIMAGFSQGGAVALKTGLCYPKTLAGIMGLSTYLPLRDSLADEAQAANKATSIFMAHGNFDPVVPFSLGLRSSELLKQKGYEVQWHEYPMQHQVCWEEIQHIGAWMKARLRLDAVA